MVAYVMRFKRHIILLLLLSAPGCTRHEPVKTIQAPEQNARLHVLAPTKTVRVAAVQFCSAFGEPAANRKGLSLLVRRAAKQGAKIVVLPEAAIPGYVDMTREIYWTRGRIDRHHRHLRRVAERIDGESVQCFRSLAKELAVYLTVPIIERARGRYYITVLLLAPDGKTVIHHRKQTLWDVGEGEWASEGDLPAPIADTPYGRIGVMICRDMHTLPEVFAEKHVDIVLHSSGFYGPNFEGYLRSNKFLRKIREGHFALVLANWSVKKESWWQGYGMSRIIDRQGKLVARVENDLGNAVVVADLPVTVTP